MKNGSFSLRSPYCFKHLIHVNKSGMKFKFLKLPLYGSQVELEPILRWEDDGGQMTDAAALQSSQQGVDQPENTVALALRLILDPFSAKLLHIQPM